MSFTNLIKILFIIFVANIVLADDGKYCKIMKHSISSIPSLNGTVYHRGRMDFFNSYYNSYHVIYNIVLQNNKCESKECTEHKLKIFYPANCDTGECILQYLQQYYPIGQVFDCRIFDIYYHYRVFPELTMYNALFIIKYTILVVFSFAIMFSNTNLVLNIGYN